MPSRSHHGCARCKRRRQKCDEKRPSCSRCLQAAVLCEYVVALKWDGRVPRRQQPLQRKKRKVDIYDASFDPAGIKESGLVPSSSKQADFLIPTEVTDIVQIHELDALGTLSSTDKLLLHHFVTEASMIASHTHLREQICQQILPMALHIPSLMYATMALSALHRTTLLNQLPNRFIPEAMVSELVSTSLGHLRRELQNQNSTERQLLLHTIRTLCVCEIYSGKADSSWRVHVDGARAILDSVRSNNGGFGPDSDQWLTERWYSSIEALSAVTIRGLTQSPLQQEQDPRSTFYTTKNDDTFLDIYTGYSSDLNLVFMEIGSLSRRLKQAESRSGEVGMLSEALIQNEAHRLELVVRGMIRRDKEEGLKIPCEVSLQKDEIRQFNACNAAYQHSALIHTYRRILRLESHSPEVQGCVRKILEVVCGVLPMIALSPWALLTTPIFTAG